MAKPRPSKRERIARREAAARAAAELATVETAAQMVVAQAGGTVEADQDMQGQQEPVPDVNEHGTEDTENTEKRSDKEFTLWDILEQGEKRLQATEAQINELHKDVNKLYKENKDLHEENKEFHEEIKELRAAVRFLCDKDGDDFNTVVASYCDSK